MPGFNPVLAACACALFYGTSTFLAGRATVRLGPSVTLGLFQGSGFLCAVLLLLMMTGLTALSAMPPGDLLLAALSGLCFSLGWVCFGQGLASGRVTIVASVECMTSISFVAMIEGLTVGWMDSTQLGGIGLAAIAAMLVALGSAPASEQTGSIGRSVQFGAMAGVLFGCSYLALGFVSPPAAVTSLVVMRFVAAGASLLWLALNRSSAAKPENERRVGSSGGMVLALGVGAVLAVAGGIADGLGTCAFVLSTSNGLVGIAVAILSLYAAVTVAMGIVILKEKPSVRQLSGFAAALAAIVMLAG